MNAGDIMEEMLTLALKRIDELEKKLERYYNLLKVENELDFILKVTYLVEADMQNIMSGNY